MTRRGEEQVNPLTHEVGIVASLAAGSVLIALAALGGDALIIVGVSVFATSLIALYTNTPPRPSR